MFKKILISLFFVAVSTISVSVFAATSESVSALTAANNVDKDVTLLQVSDIRLDQTKNRVLKTQSIVTEKSESVLSTEWLFVVALLMFVMLSNRRHV